MQLTHKKIPILKQSIENLRQVSDTRLEEMAEDKSWDETIKSFHHADDKEEEGEDANGVIDYLKGCDSSDGDDLSAASCDECVVVSALFNVSSILTN